MIKRTLAEIAAMVEGQIHDSMREVMVAGVTNDTRKITDANLFVPLQGERSNGHDHVQQAFEQGASASFWERNQPNPPVGAPLIFVEDSLKALQQLAKAYLNELGAKVIGITGSNGKTTTKDMTASILGTKYRVHKTSGNYNNHIGLPLTVLSAPEDTEMLILEMGMSSRGEISLLSKIGQPDAAIITNIGDECELYTVEIYMITHGFCCIMGNNKWYKCYSFISTRLTWSCFSYTPFKTATCTWMVIKGLVKPFCGIYRFVEFFGHHPQPFYVVYMVMRYKYKINRLNPYIMFGQPLLYCPWPYSGINEEPALFVSYIIAVSVAPAA